MSNNNNKMQQQLQQQLQQVSSVLKTIKEKEKDISRQIKIAIFTNILTGLSVVCAFAWKDVLEQLFSKVGIFNRDSWWGRLIFPLFLTIIVVVITVLTKDKLQVDLPKIEYD